MFISHLHLKYIQKLLPIMSNLKCDPIKCNESVIEIFISRDASNYFMQFLSYFSVCRNLTQLCNEKLYGDFSFWKVYRIYNHLELILDQSWYVAHSPWSGHKEAYFCSRDVSLFQRSFSWSSCQILVSHSLFYILYTWKYTKSVTDKIS